MNGCFRFFLRKNYPEVANISNDECDELGELFDIYLKETIKEETFDKIYPKNELEVVMNMDHPLKQNGFHPALIIHFNNFVEKQMEKNKK